MLFAGTALGAVRHKGFIPWDDDLDVIMLREDYERFIMTAAEDLPEEFYLQTEFSQHWPMFFSKLRKNGTTCMEKFYPKDQKMHQGVYIDVFPGDNLSDGWLKRKLQFLASKTVIANALSRRGYITDRLLKKMFIMFAKLFPVKPMHSFAANRSDTDSELVHTFFGASSKYAKSVFPRTWFTETELMKFEDGMFPVSSHYEELLTTLYGDWRTEPTEDEKAYKVHGVIVV
jgi:lipopolysaccharide cholinephosphotransferase